MKKIIITSFIFFIIFSCKKEKVEKPTIVLNEYEINYAKGFKVSISNSYKIIEVSSPWPNSNDSYTYVLIEKGAEEPKDIEYNAIIEIPVEKIIVTSTTHIPALEALGVENTLVGFPGANYISSEKTRKHIDSGKIKELGANETMNTEIVLDLEPELIIGFSINNQNKSYDILKSAGIPLVYNGDWVEQTPLGKAEWIKFFAPFFKKEKEADSIFSKIENDYLYAKKLAENAQFKPSVFSGGMYKDVWYLPAGKSWASQFFKDANTNYLWKETEGTGSLSLSFESVYEKAEKADFWIGTSQFTSYEELDNINSHYGNFKAYKEKKAYTTSLTKGNTGGYLFYELAPNRPDIVLKDIIHIVHPELLPNHDPFFYKPLK